MEEKNHIQETIHLVTELQLDRVIVQWKISWAASQSDTACLNF